MTTITRPCPDCEKLDWQCRADCTGKITSVFDPEAEWKKFTPEQVVELANNLPPVLRFWKVRLDHSEPGAVAYLRRSLSGEDVFSVFLNDGVWRAGCIKDVIFESSEEAMKAADKELKRRCWILQGEIL